MSYILDNVTHVVGKLCRQLGNTCIILNWGNITPPYWSIVRRGFLGQKGQVAWDHNCLERRNISRRKQAGVCKIMGCPKSRRINNSGLQIKRIIELCENGPQNRRKGNSWFWRRQVWVTAWVIGCSWVRKRWVR